MRKIIIDTDVCSDDAAAILLALKSSDVEVLAITTVSGGVLLPQATQNALMTCEVCGARVPVYKGAAKPLFRQPFITTAAHGADGMGACGLIHPVGNAVPDVHASDAILNLINQHPDQIDLIALGPVTNLGLAILKDPDTMRRLKRIFIMGTGGFGPGNITPVAEANVFTDAESFDLVLNLGVPTSILGFDLCIGDSAFDESNIDTLLNSAKPEAIYVAKAARKLIEYNLHVRGRFFVDMCDAVAMGCYLWPDIIVQQHDCAARVCTQSDAYGQVIFYTEAQLQSLKTFGIPFDETRCRCQVIAQIDCDAFKQRAIDILIQL